jgi:hypothetical protein
MAQLLGYGAHQRGKMSECKGIKKTDLPVLKTLHHIKKY